MSGHDARVVAGHQAMNDGRRQRVVPPELVAADYDTYVHIVDRYPGSPQVPLVKLSIAPRPSACHTKDNLATG
jgi:hypothetical protein